MLIIIDKVSDKYDIGNAYSEWLWPGYSVIYFNDHWNQAFPIDKYHPAAFAVSPTFVSPVTHLSLYT